MRVSYLLRFPSGTPQLRKALPDRLSPFSCWGLQCFWGKQGEPSTDKFFQTQSYPSQVRCLWAASAAALLSPLVPRLCSGASKLPFLGRTVAPNLALQRNGTNNVPSAELERWAA